MAPRGFANISPPGLFGLHLQLEGVTTYIYYLMIVLVLLTIFVTNRLKDSRIGRAWMALREDEIACVAMGIDMARTKLSAYALGAFWAGLVGVIFAARNTYINPNSFTFMESAIVLSIVVLGGMGSILGVIIAALVLMLTPRVPAGVFRLPDAGLRRRPGADDDFPPRRADRQPPAEVRVASGRGGRP